MHIPDGVLDPRVAVATGLVGAAGLAYGLRVVERQLGERTTALMGMCSAFVFAAQMVNFPVGPGVSGHLLGGVLAAVILGPWAGSVAMASVLIVQCFLFGDGGLTALGANFVNMGLIGSVGGYAIYRPIRRWLGGKRGVLIGAMAAAWFAVLLAAGACAIELSLLGGRTTFMHVLSWMGLVHAAIGLGEALITGMVVRLVLLTRPDLIDPDLAGAGDIRGGSPHRGWVEATVAGLAIALAVAVFLAPFASESPDGLEYVASVTEAFSEEASPVISAPLPDYELPLAGSENVRVATALAGLVGTLVVFGFGWGLARVFSAAGGSRAARMAADAT